MNAQLLTAHGLTMHYAITRGRIPNAANPYTLWGYVNGECRMQCGISAATATNSDRIKTLIANRLAKIAAEVAA